MELRHLLYFKTLAEELHFRRAAEKLFISQPPLSRQIKELEQELGTALFTRDTKHVALTEAGVYFKQEVDALFLRLEESKNLVQQMGQSVCGQLRIGYISSTYHASLVNILRDIRGVFPFIKTKLYEVPTVKQVQALEEGKLDVGILRAPVLSESLHIHSLFTDPFVLAMPATGQRLPDQQALVKSLKGQPFVFFNREYAPDYHRKLVEICQRLGFSPEVQHEANTIHSILRLVEQGMGVTLVPASVQAHYPHLNLYFYSLDWLPISTEVVLAYKHTQLSPAVSWFIARYSALFGNASAASTTI